MLSKYPVLRLITKFVLPFIIFFGLYIQINGEVSPGGGFQAGAIFASALIAMNLISKTRNHYNVLRNLATTGVFIYTATGVAPLLLGYKYLDYFALAQDPQAAQKIGIFVIELGVGITVSAGMLLIYFLFDVECDDA